MSLELNLTYHAALGKRKAAWFFMCGCPAFSTGFFLVIVV